MSVTAQSIAITDPKYRIKGNAIINSATGTEIPSDEPIFILRAKDVFAIQILKHYQTLAAHGQDQSHRLAIAKRIHEFQEFKNTYPDRMKQPDTDLSSWPE